MAYTTAVKGYINACLRHVNLQLDTLTAVRAETRRLKALEATQYFTRPVFPVPPAFASIPVDDVLAEVARHRQRFEDFARPEGNSVGYSFDNIFYTSPDAEVLYAMMRRYAPGTVVEIGSGNSTKIMRQAVADGRLQTRLISIDPQPRTEIDTLVDQKYREPLSATTSLETFSSLRAGDLLFIDSSHVVRSENDVVFLYLTVLPQLPAGVLVQVHDIFLPYDYPSEWVVERGFGFNEQYLVQALLASSDDYEVLWAGYFHQRTRDDFGRHFPHMGQLDAKSLWLRKKHG